MHDFGGAQVPTVGRCFGAEALVVIPKSLSNVSSGATYCYIYFERSNKTLRDLRVVCVRVFAPYEPFPIGFL